MNHPFSPKDGAKTCGVCDRDYVSHTPAAKCEACSYLKPCDVFNNRLLCEKCAQKEKDFLETALVDVNAVIEKARAIDQSIRYSGDLWNAKTVGIMELKAAFDALPDLTAQEKAFKFQIALAQRFEHLQQVNFEHNKELHENSVEQLAISKTLRDFGNELRADIREKIKQQDNNYQPIRVIPQVKVKKAVKKSPFDTMVENVMVSKNISKEEAERQIKAMMGI